jgi:hypothetical protein
MTYFDRIAQIGPVPTNKGRLIFYGAFTSLEGKLCNLVLKRNY